jgi:L-lactate dehydrogenase complex protein LldF
VYERTGGHAYGSVYPGPIGAILTPQLRGTDTEIDRSLPYASSLCGACFEVCPVRIDIPQVLVHLRARVVDSKRAGVPTAEQLVMRSAAWTFSDHRRLERAQQAAGLGGRLFRRGRIGRLPFPLSKWTDARDAPAPPRESFRAWWRRTRGEQGTRGGQK